MLNTLVALTKEFVSIRSSAENKSELDKILRVATAKLDTFTVEKFESNASKSVLIYNTKRRPKKFNILLNGHLDVVPGRADHYTPQIKGNRLYGVGSMDMKANAACLIMAFKDVATKVQYPLGLQLVTDEEIGGFNGTKYQIDQGVRTNFVIAGEPTNFNIVHKAKGIIWVKISSKGKTAHGAYPWKGENAVWNMNTFLDALKKKFPLPLKQDWVTTINLSNIETTNQSFNKIPDSCTVWLDIRYIPEDAKTILPSIKKLLPKGFTVEVLTNEPSLFVDANNSYIQQLIKTTQGYTNKRVEVYGAQGSSDARHFTRIGNGGIEFGPIGGGIGTDHEWVDIPSLETYYKILTTFLLSYNSDNA